MLQFTECDTDHDGRITFKQFTDMLYAQGYTEDDVKRLFPEETNQDELMDFNEFKRYLNFRDQVEEEEEID